MTPHVALATSPHLYVPLVQSAQRTNTCSTISALSNVQPATSMICRIRPATNASSHVSHADKEPTSAAHAKQVTTSFKGRADRTALLTTTLETRRLGLVTDAPVTAILARTA